MKVKRTTKINDEIQSQPNRRADFTAIVSAKLSTKTPLIKHEFEMRCRHFATRWPATTLCCRWSSTSCLLRFLHHRPLLSRQLQLTKEAKKAPRCPQQRLLSPPVDGYKQRHCDHR